MRHLILTCAASLFLSSGVAHTQELPGQVLQPVDTAELNTALDKNDARAIVDALYQKSFSLTDDQKKRIVQQLGAYMVKLQNPSSEEYNRTIAVLSMMMMAKPVDTPQNSPPGDAPASGGLIRSTTDPVRPEATEEIAKAIEAKNGLKLVEIITASDFSTNTVSHVKPQLVEVILEYARPIPASNAAANKSAYQALTILEPQNSDFKKKFEQYSTAEKESRATALKKLKKEDDEFSGVTFYTHPSKPRYADQRNYLLPYIAKKGNAIIVRVELHYTADSWLFVRNAKFNVDGEMIPFNVPSSEWNKDNDSEIWEWVDVPINSELKELLVKVSNSKKTIVRFDGSQYYDDFIVTDKDKQAIRDVFAAEEVLRGYK